jgi:hypothetical protein
MAPAAMMLGFQCPPNAAVEFLQPQSPPMAGALGVTILAAALDLATAEGPGPDPLESRQHAAGIPKSLFVV